MVYKGIDVSKWQNEIDWLRVKNSGIQFAMIRASYGWGDSLVDGCFKVNYERAKRVGIAVGAYHYSYAMTPEEAVKEAEHCYNVIKGKTFEYPIAFDMEESRVASLGREKVSAIAKAFCEKMESYGYYVCIYANLNWLTNYFTDEIFKHYDIWLAQWNDKPTFTKPYGIWQKTSKGRVDGIVGNVDLDESYKNYPSIMKYNGLNGFEKKKPVKPTRPNVSFRAGQKVTLKNASLYSSATSEKVVKRLSGEYFVYDGICINGRYRVTNSVVNVKRRPIGKYVTGFVRRDELG